MKIIIKALTSDFNCNFRVTNLYKKLFTKRYFKYFKLSFSFFCLHLSAFVQIYLFFVCLFSYFLYQECKKDTKSYDISVCTPSSLCLLTFRTSIFLIALPLKWLACHLQAEARPDESDVRPRWRNGLHAPGGLWGHFDRKRPLLWPFPLVQTRGEVCNAEPTEAYGASRSLVFHFSLSSSAIEVTCTSVFTHLGLVFYDLSVGVLLLVEILHFYFFVVDFIFPYDFMSHINFPFCIYYFIWCHILILCCFFVVFFLILCIILLCLFAHVTPMLISACNSYKHLLIALWILDNVEIWGIFVFYPLFIQRVWDDLYVNPLKWRFILV